MSQLTLFDTDEGILFPVKCVGCDKVFKVDYQTYRDKRAFYVCETCRAEDVEVLHQQAIADLDFEAYQRRLAQSADFQTTPSGHVIPLPPAQATANRVIPLPADED